MTATEKPVEPVADAPVGPLPRRPWWNRSLDPADRRRVMTDLAIVRVEHWTYRFVIMLTLSVVVAVMGLALNSAAVVIGAMLLAPLMQPVLATGGCLSMALFSKSLAAFLKVVIATLWCVAIAYVIWALLPDAQLTDEINARTGPDIKDLFVALAAGTAGAYATVRSDVSSSLPGVAVAVALVPPIATVGITLNAGEPGLAWGAMLLYTTNLAAIIFASIAVFIATGFVPGRRIQSNATRLAIATVLLTVVVAIVTYPLYQASVSAVQQNTDNFNARQAVDQWLVDHPDEFDTNVVIEDGRIVVTVQGFEKPPDQAELEAILAEDFPGFPVSVEVIRLERATTTTTRPPLPQELLIADARPLVEQWLGGSGQDFSIDNIVVEGETLRIDASGTSTPPPLQELEALLRDSLDPQLWPGSARVSVNWLQRETIDAVTPQELVEDALFAATEEWAQNRDYLIREFSYDAENQVIEVEVAGAEDPDGVDLRFLERLLRNQAENQNLEVRIYFISRLPITTTTRPATTNSVSSSTTTS